jgi:hypothetical protein
MTTNKTNYEAKKQAIEINELVFLYNEGKHLVDSFTKTSIRFKCVRSNKIQTINKNTFLKTHFFTKDNFWTSERKGRLAPNMDYL